MKKIFKILTVVLLIIASITVINDIDSVFATNKEVKVYVDGQQVDFPDAKPFIIEGRTMVPVSFIAKRLQATVTWEPVSKVVTITKESDKITLRIGSYIGHKNGDLMYTDVPAEIVNGRTMIPLNFISQNLDASVSWEAETQSVLIDTSIKPKVKIMTIDEIIKEYSKVTKAWGLMYESDPESTKEYLVDLAYLAENQDDLAANAGYTNKNDGGYIIGYINIRVKDVYMEGADIKIWQHGLTQGSYWAVWAALDYLLSDSDAQKVWQSIIDLMAWENKVGSAVCFFTADKVTDYTYSINDYSWRTIDLNRIQNNSVLDINNELLALVKNDYHWAKIYSDDKIAAKSLLVDLKKYAANMGVCDVTEYISSTNAEASLYMNNNYFFDPEYTPGRRMTIELSGEKLSYNAAVCMINYLFSGENAVKLVKVVDAAVAGKGDSADGITGTLKGYSYKAWGEGGTFINGMENRYYFETVGLDIWENK